MMVLEGCKKNPASFRGLFGVLLGFGGEKSWFLQLRIFVDDLFTDEGVTSSPTMPRKKNIQRRHYKVRFKKNTRLGNIAGHFKEDSPPSINFQGLC